MPASLNPERGATAQKPEGLTVACYTFPNFHRSALNDRIYGPGWTEYVLMRGARPWFPGHHQPRQPLLGQLDEREPSTWERYVDLAADHGVDVFIWDYYWYDGRPELHEALDEGFLGARNSDRLKFAVMWTNHDWAMVYPTMASNGISLHPVTHGAPEAALEVRQSLSYLIARYFHLPNYWTIDGTPVLVVWDAGRLMRTLGAEGTRDLLEELREFARRLGHQGIHFHASHGSRDVYAALDELGFDSYGQYNPIHVAARDRPSEEELPTYQAAARDVIDRVWVETAALSSLPFWPGVSPGWDNTPRFVEPPRPAAKPDRKVWPAVTVVVGETPTEFGRLVRASFAYLRDRPHVPRVLTVGSWNEWTEGHYLLPDTRFGLGMLKALGEAVGRLPPTVPGRSPIDGPGSNDSLEAG